MGDNPTTSPGQSESKLFANIKYKLTGKVSEDVINCLKNGGGEGSTYFSDYLTHCVVGEDPSETDIIDAKDLYEIPAIRAEWVTLSKKCGKLLPTKPFLAGEDLLFMGVWACLSQLTKEDCSHLWAMIRFNGGACSMRLTTRTTHLIVGKAEGPKYDHLIHSNKTDVQIITPDWVVESLNQKIRLQESLYHPRLIIQPDRKVSDLASTFSTAHITGFADDVSKESAAAPKLSNELLEQLKQRMPWNQPQLTMVQPPPSQPPTSNLPDTKDEVKQPHQTFILQQQSMQPKPHQLVPQPIILQQQQQRLQVQQWRAQQQPGQQQQVHQQLQIHQQQTQPVILQQQSGVLPQQPAALQQSAILQQQTAVLQQQQQSAVLQQQQQTAGLQQQQSVGLQQQQTVALQQQQQTAALQQHQQTAGLQQQQQTAVLQQQQTAVLQQQQQSNVMQQQPVVLQQQSTVLQQQQQVAGAMLLTQSQSIGEGQQQFLVSQAQLRPQQPQLIHQQSKPVIQQQFIVREAPPHLVQPQYAETKPAGQFTWQQQYTTQTRQQILATPQQPQQQPSVQQRQVTWMQQAQGQGGVRQLIQMDPQTHAQLQLMDPQQRAIFLQRVQKQRQLVLQRQLQQNRTAVVDQTQVQFVRTAGGVTGTQPQPQPQTVIRGQMGPQHQLQWLQQQQQQQHRNQIVLQQNRQQVLVQQQQQQVVGTPLIRPQQRMPVSVVTTQQPWQQQQDQQQGPQQSPNIRHQQQLQLQRLQQIHLQQKQQQQTVAPPKRMHYTGGTQQPVLLAQQQDQQQDPNTQQDMFIVTNGGAGTGGAAATGPQGLVVNAKTKTALANMLSNRLQSGVAPSPAPDGSAAGQLRLMGAQHQTAPPPPLPPPQAPPAAPPFQRTTLASVSNTRVSEGAPVASYVQTAARVAAVLAKSASATPPASHHHRPQFYGHNPNFKLPPEMFLLGCVFLIMEYDRSGFDVTMWRRIILENGGETELTYSLKVTHILCQTQKHPLVQQGLRDGKRCVTAEWLSDVMIKQQVIPPWLALHFPTPFSDEKPCRNLIISHSGFEGDERVRVKKMIEAVGAKMTSYYTSHNNILVCRRPEGEKYRKAREWCKSVVNVQWLNEVLFGHYSCLQHTENQKYQQFNIANPFRIDYTLIPHLMGAWKVPIQVTHECYERAKSSGIVGPKRKRQRLASPPSEQENVPMIVMPQLQPLGSTNRPMIMFSGATAKQSDDEKKILHLGGGIATSCQNVTHLVVYKLQRSLKLMCCLSSARYVVNVKWIADSFVNKRFVDEQQYIVDDVEFEKKHNCNILKVLSNSDRSKLFAGKTFYITPGVLPARSALAEMIECAGGVVERQRRSLKNIQELEPNTYFVITVFNDFHLVSDLIRANVGLYNAEFIMSSILTQKIPYEAAFRKNNSKNKI